ncbi:hypothetical protein F441_14261 [Phytophthora nicotianae CJ01A1]|uniref:Uncharacterized protein n=1 Tax=Phytophthora nicotianae CJ01A1 TaxID=1317063 RepID=W2WI29_PHYNI|nr:hypothetical protein F441_14261 [Phytophthora nicotianae CJ01A1]
MRRKRKKDDYPKDWDVVEESQDPDEYPPRVTRPDVIARRARNKIMGCVAVKTSLNTFCKRGGRFLPGRALPWEEVLADMNKGVLEAYLLANLHILRLLKENKEIPKLDGGFFRSCLSAVMKLLRYSKVKGELGESLKIYNSSRCARSPQANGGYINQGRSHNAGYQMATMTKNALSMNFYRRFHKFLKRTYTIDGKQAYTLLKGILSHEEYVRTGTRFDEIVLEWRAKVPRKPNGYLADEAHQLIPLTYLLLQDIEDRNTHGKDAIDEGELFQEIRVFSILPTKKGFECSHMKMCQLGLWGLLKRAGFVAPKPGKGWEDVQHDYLHKLFNIKKFETETRKFAGEIVTDGKAVSIMMRKPKKEAGPARTYTEKDIDVVWGLDPGRRDMFVATNQFEESVSCSSKEFYEEARYTKAKQKIKGWQDRHPKVLEAIRNMPTKKTASLEKLKVYIAFMTQHMDLLLGFSQLKPFRRLRFRSFLFMKKKLRQLCERLAPRGKRVVVGFGDWSNQDVAGIIKKSPAGPVKVFERELARYCTVIPIAEFRTSKVHFECQRRLKNQYSQRLCRDGEIRTQKVHSVLHCLNNGCRGMTVNRNVNASRNMRRLLECKLRRPSLGLHSSGKSVITKKSASECLRVAQERLIARKSFSSIHILLDKICVCN